jgi:uncharacterized protein YjbI with pentapeptide repeats
VGIEPYEISGLERAVNDTAARTSGLWLSFLSFITYLAITVGTVTHRMLFLANDIKLPLLNAELPLEGFFLIAPVLLLIFHFYLLLQFVALDRRITTYNKAVQYTGLDLGNQVPLRRRLDPFVLVQLLAGAPDERTGIMALTSRLMIVITVVIAPLSVLVLTQLTFLPYHHEAVTWCHRLAILVDLAIVWIVWPLIFRKHRSSHARGRWRFAKWRHVVEWRLLSHWRYALVLACSAIMIAFSTLVATYPGETADANWLSQTLDQWVTFSIAGERKPLSIALFGGPVNVVLGKPRSLFSNVIVVVNDKFVDDDKLDKLERTIVLRGRDLRGAVLFNSDLRKADFTGANLVGAHFDRSRVANAKFECKTTGMKSPSDAKLVSLPWPDDGCTWLQRATFNLADLTGTAFTGAHLDDAQLTFGTLNEASFEDAHMPRAIFSFSSLQKSSLKNADLSGAIFGAPFGNSSLDGASFAGANLGGAVFQNLSLNGSIFDKAKLHATVLANVGLLGSSFEEADLALTLISFSDLRGASLKNAVMQGAQLANVLLQGGDLTGVQIKNSEIFGGYIWRATSDAKTSVTCSQLFGVKTDAITLENFSDANSNAVPVDDSQVEPALSKAIQFVDNDDQKTIIKSRFARLKQASASPDQDKAAELYWKNVSKKHCAPADRRAQLMELFKSIACETVYTAAAMTKRISSLLDRNSGIEVAKYMLDPQKCRGAVQIDDEARETLKTLATAANAK